MINRNPLNPGANSLYTPEEWANLKIIPTEPFNPNRFGCRLPDNEVINQFSLGPWHELRRQITLFAQHVRPADGAKISPRRDPGPKIDKDCDMWIVMCLQFLEEKKALIPAPDALRKWLHVRAMMGLSYIDYAIRNQHKVPPPDLKNKFKSEVGWLLVIFWQEAGKKTWIENDPDKTSTAE